MGGTLTISGFLGALEVHVIVAPSFIYKRDSVYMEQKVLNYLTSYEWI